jgi:hypothetical protein
MAMEAPRRLLRFRRSGNLTAARVNLCVVAIAVL